MTENSPFSYQHRLVNPDLPTPAELLPLLEEMCENGWYSNFGPLVQRFEARLLARFGVDDECCVTCSNATAGLTASLLATRRKGSVLIPAFTFPASLGAVRAAGMTPIVMDVNADSWAIGGDQLERALVHCGASVVMLVAPFGMARDWTHEIAFCRAHGVSVVIDNASGLGGPRGGGTLGSDVFEVFSMHATKPFAVGEGGAIFAHRAHDASLRSALNFALASHPGDSSPQWGFNGKMSELHAAVGLAQLPRFDRIIADRQKIAGLYQDLLMEFTGLAYPQDMGSAPWQFFPVLLPSGAAAERFIAIAAQLGVEIRRYYRPSLSRWPDTPCAGPCPVAEDLAERMCMLPVSGANAGSNGALILTLVKRAFYQALAY